MPAHIVARRAATAVLVAALLTVAGCGTTSQPATPAVESPTVPSAPAPPVTAPATTPNPSSSMAVGNRGVEAALTQVDQALSDMDSSLSAADASASQETN